MPALAKRVLNPDNKWLWIVGGVVVLGGTYWYFSRKKEEKPVDTGPTNFTLVSTRAQAEKLALEPVTGKIVTVWERFSPPELLAETKEAATNHGGVKFYYFKEAALAPNMPDNVVAVVASAEDGALKFRSIVQDTSVNPTAEAVSRFQEALLAVTEPALEGAPLTEAATLADMWNPYVIAVWAGE